MAWRIKGLDSLAQVELLRTRLADRPRDLFLFDLFTQTGLSLDQAIGLRFGELLATATGAEFFVTGPGGISRLGVMMTARLRRSLEGFARATGAGAEDFVFQSRKGGAALARPSVSRLVSGWFKEMGWTGLAGVKSLRRTWEDHFRAGPAKPAALGGGVETAEELNPATLSDKIRSRLVQLILTGRLKPGQKLIIRRIAQEMGISAQPVRDALARLESSALVRLDPNRTFRVNALSLGDLDEITRLRRLLEPQAAEAACLAVGPTQIAALRAAAEQWAQSVEEGDPDEYLRLNREFHYQLYQPSNQPILLQFIDKLWDMISPYHYLLARQIGLYDFSAGGIKYHRAMIESLERRDCRELSRWIKADIDYSVQRVKDMFHRL